MFHIELRGFMQRACGMEPHFVVIAGAVVVPVVVVVVVVVVQ